VTGVDKDTRVRWRQGRGWRLGHVTSTRPGVNNTFDVREDRTGEMVTVPATGLERETTGPRGGRRWEALVVYTNPRPTSRRHLAGQLGLFDINAGEPGQ
jgi:hypothetical protein